MLAELRGRMVQELGSARQREAIVLLSATLALDSADRGSIGVVAPSLKHAFGLSNGDIGALAAAFSIVGMVGTVPAGLLTDRVSRTRTLAIGIAVWSVAMAIVGFSNSYSQLFVSRLFLGAITAIAFPVTVSLTGDLFSPDQRARIMGWIDGGELIGAGIGFMIAGLITIALGWRAVYWFLALPGAVLAVKVWRMPEPARRATSEDARHALLESTAARAVDESDVEPDPDRVIHEDAREMPLLRALRWTLRVPTNVCVIAASCIGSFFFSGVRTFAVIFVIDQYAISRGAAVACLPLVMIGALAGTIAGGRLADELLLRIGPRARLFVPAASYALAAVALLPALLTHSIAIALPLFVVGGFALGSPNPGLDAARLDIVHPELWGRAESVRSVIRTLADALAPLVFGVLADHLAHGSSSGLQAAFVLLLPLLFVNSVLLVVGARTYATDIATVSASLNRPTRSGVE